MSKNSGNSDLVCKNITIHHECPCSIEISHLRSRKFNQGRSLPRPWLNYNPEGEIFLPNMERLMMDCFSPTFPSFLSEHKKPKHEKMNLLLVGFTLFQSSQMFLSGIKMGEN